MRIVGGRARGVTLRVLQDPGLRPTTDRVRGAIFSMLEARETVTEMRVLDLYAGTGAMGIEALSRGAAHADFVERRPRTGAVILENAKRAGVNESATVHTASVSAALASLSGPYDLVFMDPPYEDTSALEDTVRRLCASPSLLAPHALIAAEQASRAVRNLVDAADGGLEPVQERRYGDTTVSILRRISQRQRDGEEGATSP